MKPFQAILLAAAAAACCQAQPPAPAEESGAVFRTGTSMVVCHTTVTDPQGRLVTNLPQSAFHVFEDGVEQQISSFRREDIPVAVGLIIDDSPSMVNRRARVEAAALALVTNSHPDDEVFVVNFSEEAFLDNPPRKAFMSDIREMEKALSQRHPPGETAMRDALRYAIDHLRGRARRDKRVLVVVTDGADNRSVITQAALLRAAQLGDVMVYCVGLLGEEDPAAAAEARRSLTEIAAATGGESFFPADLAEVDRIAHQVARDIRNQYTIGYSPAKETMDGRYRKIRITVDAPGNPVVRTRQGYYASGEDGGGSQ